MMPSAQTIIDRCKQLNINRATKIICYDQHKLQWASRAAVIFWAHGFTDVNVMQGSLSLWVYGGKETEEGLEQPSGEEAVDFGDLEDVRLIDGFIAGYADVQEAD